MVVMRRLQLVIIITVLRSLCRCLQPPSSGRGGRSVYFPVSLHDFELFDSHPQFTKSESLSYPRRSSSKTPTTTAKPATTTLRLPIAQESHAASNEFVTESPGVSYLTNSYYYIPVNDAKNIQDLSLTTKSEERKVQKYPKFNSISENSFYSGEYERFSGSEEIIERVRLEEHYISPSPRFRATVNSQKRLEEGKYLDLLATGYVGNTAESIIASQSKTSTALRNAVTGGRTNRKNKEAVWQKYGDNSRVHGDVNSNLDGGRSPSVYINTYISGSPTTLNRHKTNEASLNVGEAKYNLPAQSVFVESYHAEPTFTTSIYHPQSAAIARSRKEGLSASRKHTSKITRVKPTNIRSSTMQVTPAFHRKIKNPVMTRTNSRKVHINKINEWSKKKPSGQISRLRNTRRKAATIEKPAQRRQFNLFPAPSRLSSQKATLDTVMVVASIPRFVQSDRNMFIPNEYGARAIPGEAGRDYPVLHSVPATHFSCGAQQHPGLYADSEASCQVFHICQSSGQHDSFLCPNGTMFHQQFFVCDWWYNVACQAASTFFSLNEFIYAKI